MAGNLSVRVLGSESSPPSPRLGSDKEPEERHTPRDWGVESRGTGVHLSLWAGDLKTRLRKARSLRPDLPARSPLSRQPPPFRKDWEIPYSLAGFPAAAATAAAAAAAASR